MTLFTSCTRFTLSALALAALSAAAGAADQPVIGLITKTDTNPFFVKMKEGAQAAATAKGAKLLSAAGKADGDNAGQVTAIENMIAGGAKTILITPNDSKAIVPAIKKAQDKGVMFIALDSPADPMEATDALFATDNYKAGVVSVGLARRAQQLGALGSGRRLRALLHLHEERIGVGLGDQPDHRLVGCAGHSEGSREQRADRQPDNA